jgi:hypothetical protein
MKDQTCPARSHEVRLELLYAPRAPHIDPADLQRTTVKKHGAMRYSPNSRRPRSSCSARKLAIVWSIPSEPKILRNSFQRGGTNAATLSSTCGTSGPEKPPDGVRSMYSSSTAESNQVPGREDGPKSTVTMLRSRTTRIRTGAASSTTLALSNTAATSLERTLKPNGCRAGKRCRSTEWMSSCVIPPSDYFLIRLSPFSAHLYPLSRRYLTSCASADPARISLRLVAITNSAPAAMPSSRNCLLAAHWAAGDMASQTSDAILNVFAPIASPTCKYAGW